MILYSMLAFMIGILITVHMGMNAQFGVLLGSTRLGNIIFWGAGLAAAFFISLPSQDFTLLRKVPQIPPWLFFAGALGSAIAVFTGLSIPRIGAVNLTMLLFLGQLAASSILSANGWLGSARSPLSAWKLAGIAVALLGTAMTLYGDRLFSKS